MKPVMKRRAVNSAIREAALAAGYSELQANILGARLPESAAVDIRAHVSPTLRMLDAPDRLPDIAIAAERIADFVMDESQRAIIISDHDVDGISGHSVLRTALIEYFGVNHHRLGGVLSHKRREGFGVSDALLERMIQQYPPPALCITVDQGSQDNERFKKMQALGYVTICTDHHHVDEPPSAAIACVNPSRHDSEFADASICGAHVAWLVACAVRRVLIKRGVLAGDSPNLAPLLDIVSSAVVADAVNVAASKNNRAVINYGLTRMNANARPVWVAMRNILHKEGPLTAQDLGMGIGPRINALSRMGDALPGVQLMRAPDVQKAMELAAFADSENQQRKQIESQMLDQAVVIARGQAEAGRHATCVYLADGTSGVGGIVASRLVDAFGRPSVCLSPKFGQPGMLTGSLRSIPGINIIQALTAAKEADSECCLFFGGHKAAGGVSLLEEHLERFNDAFNAAVGTQRDLSKATPIYFSDGPLNQTPSEQVMDEIEALAPYGREFELPQFEGEFAVGNVRAVGDGTHLKLSLIDATGQAHDAIWFRAKKVDDPDPVMPGNWVRALYSLSANHFRGTRRIDIQIKHVSLNS